MERAQIEQSVVHVLNTVLKCNADLTTARANTPQWDSLQHIQIVFALEDELAVEFSEQEMAELDSAQKIVNMVVSLHAA